MTLKFRNPASGDVVEITYLSCVAAFFLGPLYLLAHGFGWHALIWVVLALGPAFVWDESALVVSLPLTCLLYSLLIHPMLVNQLRVKGWLPTRADAVTSPSHRGYGDYADGGHSSSTGRSLNGMVLAPTRVIAASPAISPAAGSPGALAANEITNVIADKAKPAGDQTSGAPAPSLVGNPDGDIAIK
ncbi:hypothetical protein PIN31009_03379 [Pandoraea iniqua]|uniref:hypothetical protein n=1 Tax=Pandoraea iniqua TaxID=2508288 RepID=UPI00123FEBBA|nr:hypothetical protein [Pandoraea iniqua]VVE26203.1 hypothetical protein PIN31009_03379 [Pandoraea iniqua]